MSQATPPRAFLVSGATGFIGRHFMEALLSDLGTAAVTALVHPRRCQEEEQVVADFRRRGVAVWEGDLLKLPEAKLAVPAFDIVVHLAACAEPENPRADFSVNDVGTRNLIDWLGPALAGKRFLFTSTLAVVDRASPLGPITETTPCSPRTRYGETKLRAEEEIRLGRDRFGYDFTILRLCTIIGRGFRPGGMFGVCPRLLARHALAARLDWPGRSSFLAVRDLTRILLALPSMPAAANQTFVLGNGEDLTFDQLLDQIAAVLGLPRRRVILPALLWRALGRIGWWMAGSTLVPGRMRTQCWRAAHVIHDGIWADASKLNFLVGNRYQGVRDALREAYGR